MKRKQHTPIDNNASASRTTSSPNKKKKKSQRKSIHSKSKEKGTDRSPTKITHDLEHHILKFSRLAQNEKSSDIFAGALSLSWLHQPKESDEAPNQKEESMHSTISNLSSFLISDESHPSITKVHVASLIFPWVTHALLQKKESSSKIIWEAFTLSLEILSRGSSTPFRVTNNGGVGSNNGIQLDGVLSNLLEGRSTNKNTKSRKEDSVLGTDLTQGVMNKLIPCFVRTSFQMCQDLDPNDGTTDHGADVVDSDVIQMAARCFGLIVTSDSYRPTTDYVCKELISLVEDKCKEVEKGYVVDGDHKGPNSGVLPDQAVVVYLTLKLLTQLKKRGKATNPKKTFQLVSSSQMLASMAHFCRVVVRGGDSTSGNSASINISVIIKKVICSTLYDPFHLDGLRAMNLDVPILHKNIQRLHEEGEEETKQRKPRKKGQKESSKKKMSSQPTSAQSSYLQALFDAIESLIGFGGEVSADISLFIPKLIECYISQSLESDMKSGKKKSRVDTTARIQFRFFCALMNPVLNTVELWKDSNSLQTSEHLAFLESIIQSTDLLIKHAIYLPSFEDPGNLHLNYLKAIGEVVLSVAEYQISFDIEISLHLLIAQRLFSLSHHVYHEKLSRLIAGAASKSNYDRQQMVSMELLCNICSTYQKLRQLEYFVQGMLSYAENSETFDYSSYTFIREESFVKSFNIAIQSSPIGQTQEVWKLVNQHVLDAKSTGNGATVVYAVEIFVIILKAIKVGSFSSGAVKELCEQTMSSSVTNLLGLENDENASFSKGGFDLTCEMAISGLNLWGWIVYVHTKCCFWLNEMPHEKSDQNNDNMCGYKLIPTLMATIDSVVINPEKSGRSLEAIQLLTSHLLQELHSSIFLQLQIEGLSKTDDNGNERSTNMVKEAKALSKFLVHAACSQSAGWKVLCENLETWIPYAEEEQIDSFVTWFLSMQAIEVATQEKESIIVPISKKEISIRRYSEEKAAVIALLCDASFFETPRIFQRIAPVGLSCVSKLLYDKDPEVDRGTVEIVEILNLNKSLSSEKMSFQNITDATFMLKALGSVISALDRFEHTDVLFGNILRFHRDVIRHLQSCSRSEYEQGIKMMLICNDILAATLMKDCTKSGFLIDKETSMVPNLLHYISATTKDAIDLCNKFNHSILQDSIISAGSKLFKSAVIFSINSVSDCDEHSNALAIAFQDLVGGIYEHQFSIQLMKPSLQLLVNVAEENDDNYLSELIHRITRSLLSSLKVECLEYIESVLCATSLPGGGKLSSYLYFTADLFSTDLSLAAADDTTIEPSQSKDDVLDAIMKRVVSLLKCRSINVDQATYSSILYFFGSLASKVGASFTTCLDSKLEMQEIMILHHQHCNGRTEPIIDCTYAKILSETNTEEVSSLTSHLLSPLQNRDQGDPSSKLLAIIHCFHTMVHVVKGQEQREILSSVAKILLPVAYGLVYPFDPQLYVSYEDWSIQTRSVQAFIFTMVGKNDIATLKGNDVANILATVTSTFYPFAAETQDEDPSHAKSTRLDKNVYVSSCSIVTSLLKHYSKQLYGCVPSLTCTMRSLLKHIMASGREEPGVKKMIQEFQKVCEQLPEHKDVFKKHMMHLVLYYIDGLQNVMDPWIKNELEQSVFFLLDTLSEFETKQMNTLMNPTSKALFQSVFKNYKKSEYKGQY